MCDAARVLLHLIELLVVIAIIAILAGLLLLRRWRGPRPRRSGGAMRQ